MEQALKLQGLELHDFTTTELELSTYIKNEDGSEGGMRNAFAERRVREIALWLKEHSDLNVENWVALDDVDLAA